MPHPLVSSRPSRQEGCQGLTSFPPRLLPGRKGLPVWLGLTDTAREGRRQGRCCNQQPLGLSEPQPLTTGLGREASCFQELAFNRRAETREARQVPYWLQRE